MAGNRQIVDYEEVLDADYDENHAEDVVTEIEDSLAAEFATAGNDVQFKIKLYRLVPGEKDVFLFNVTHMDVEKINARLLEEYGSGSYHARVFKNGKLHRRFDTRVEAPRTITAAPESTAIAGAVANQSRMIEGLIQKLSDSKIPQAVQSNTMQETIALMTAMMGMMQQLMPKHSDSGIDTFLKAFELARDMNDGAGNTGVLDIVKAAISSPVLQNLSFAPQAQQALPAPRPQPQPQPQPQPRPQPQPQPQPQQMSETDMNILQVGKYIVQLVAQAKKDSDPGLYADLVIDNVSPELLMHIVMRPNLKDDLVRLNSEVGLYWEWFAELISLIKDSLTATDNFADNTQKGDVSHEDQRSPVNINVNPVRPGGRGSDVEHHDTSGEIREN